MKLRVHWAVHLFKEGVARNIIFSGGAVYTPYVEAEIMSLYAQELGVPAKHCFLDPIAEHSTENIFMVGRRDVSWASPGLHLQRMYSRAR
ncbi:MAG: YdcF family protein [Flavobacteriales bacterium]|nr:YdcF family protein [Flavobacteriales bacterium]